MDYTKLPSQLVCRTRNSLEEFTNNNEMNECLVDNMLDIYYLQSSNFKERATACFNAAYYICTLILVDKHPEWSLPKYYDIAYCNQKNNIVGQAIVLSLVRVYLLHFDSDWLDKHKKLVEKLDGFLSSHWLQQGDLCLDDYSYQDAFNSLNSFSVATAPFTTTEFALRVIDQEAIEEMQIANFTWTQFTDYYKYNIMQDIVFHVGKTEDEMDFLVDSLRHDAEHFYSKNNPYYESVCNRLGEIKQDIYFHFHGAENDALMQAEIEELQYQGDVRPLKAEIAELKKEVEDLKSQLADYERLKEKIEKLEAENANKENEEEEWDDKYDDVFNIEINPHKVFEKLEYLDVPRVTEDYPRFFVFFKVLLYIGWIKNQQMQFLKWTSFHWKRGWAKGYCFKFSNNIQKEIRDAHMSKWGVETLPEISKAYRALAIEVLSKFTETVNGGKIIDIAAFYNDGVTKRINDGKKLEYPF